MEFKVVIPARYASTRLPGKVLRTLNGRPMLEYVYRVAQASGASQVIVATDDERVASAVRDFGGAAHMTEARHASGTDRLNQVAQELAWADDCIVVNLQGDEPLMPASLVGQAAHELSERPNVQISTMAGSFESVEEWQDPNVVKVLRDSEGCALYFSRAPIPWDRDGFAAGKPKLPDNQVWRHIGLYAYRVSALRQYSALDAVGIEQTEALEQLRAQYHGLRIYVGIAKERPGPGVDTEADLKRVEAILGAT